MSKLLRRKFPKFYKFYQEIIGEIYYEFLGAGSLVRRISKKRLLELEIMHKNPVEVVNNFTGIGLYNTIKPVQIESEMSELFNLVKNLNPKIICEVGTDRGGTLYLWSKAIQPNGLIISIDLPRSYRKSLNRFFYSGVNPIDCTKCDRVLDRINTPYREKGSCHEIQEVHSGI